MKYLKQLFVAIILASAFMAGYGAVSHAFPSGGILGRGQWQGYFSGVASSTNLTHVFPLWYNNSGYGYGASEAMPGHIDTAQEFIDFIYSYLVSGDPQRRTGAAFMIYTMLSVYSWWNSGRDQAIWFLDQWANTVRSEVTRGSVTWRHWWTSYINTAYQRNIDDVGWFDQQKTGWTLVFGWGAYVIRWECANPVSDNGPDPLMSPWSGTPTTTVTDGVPDPGDTPTSITTTPGATLHFSQRILNNGPGLAGTWFRVYGATSETSWTAQYWNNTALSGAPVVTRAEENIFYDGDSVAPAPGVAFDAFSARWTKTQNLPAGMYQFSTFNDDGARVFVDGVLVVDGWSGGGGRPYKAERNLAAGNHTIVVEYYEGGGPGTMQFEYKYLTQDWIYTSNIPAGDNRLVDDDENVVVPLGAPVGSKICRGLVIFWQNSWAAGHPWAPPTHPESGLANPSLSCATVIASYDLTPNVGFTVNGGASVGSIAEVGDTIAFSYAVTNSGSASSSVGCTIYGLTKTGYASAPTPPDSTSDPGFVQPPHGCPRVFGVGSTALTTENYVVPASNLNRTVCRALWVNPATPGGPGRGHEVCVRIVAKPYVRVHGGDVSAGGGLMATDGTCTPNPSAAIVGWNRGTATWAGAGAQYAVLAMSQIQDFSSALGNTGGAQRPHGFSFANTTAATGTGDFGGDFGAAPCIADHYATRPTSTTPIPASVGAMVSGSYGDTDGPGGTVTLAGGAIAGPNRISVFVDGNVYITSNITYGGTWTVNNMPSFRLIVRGHVWIDNDVSQLDGLYIAQATGTGNGIIHTCTIGASSYSPTDANFNSNCDNQKLIVNGALVANSIRLGRTSGTVSRATNGETAASGFAGEAVNYGPIMWIPQFSGGASSNTYDAITSLPPIL